MVGYDFFHLLQNHDAAMQLSIFSNYPPYFYPDTFFHFMVCHLGENVGLVLASDLL